MYFLDAVLYPFRSRGLSARIGLAAFAVLVPLFGLLGYMMSAGYGVRIIRRGVSGEALFPEFAFKDLPTGLLVLVALIFHLLPIAFIATVQGVVTPSPINAIVLVILALSLLMFSVSLIRYAASNDPRSFLDVSGSFRMLLDHPGTTLIFVLHIVALVVLISAIPGAVLLLSIYLKPANFGYAFLLIMPALVLVMILVQFSTYRLLAHFGVRLGFPLPVKEKRDIEHGYQN